MACAATRLTSRAHQILRLHSCAIKVSRSYRIVTGVPGTAATTAPTSAARNVARTLSASCGGMCMATMRLGRMDSATSRRLASSSTYQNGKNARSTEGRPFNSAKLSPARRNHVVDQGRVREIVHRHLGLENVDRPEADIDEIPERPDLAGLRLG